MTAFLFLQRFDQGAVAPLPFQPMMAILSRYGKPGRGLADVEMTFAPDAIAFGCTVVGNADTGISCVGFERPRFDAALRQLAWECLTQFGCTVFNDTLDLVYTAPGGAAALPADLLAGATCGVRAVSSAQQLWPDQFATSVAGPPRPALLYTNPNGNGPNMQMFDHGDADSGEMTIEAAIRPAACNAGTLRVLRNLELRVDAAVRNNPQYKPLYRYVHGEASLRVLESPRLTERALHATFVTGMPGEPEPDQPDFVADGGVFASAMSEAAGLAEHVRQKYQLDLDGKPPSIATLAGLLDKLHAFYCHERSKHPPGTPYHSALAATWSVKAGCYLGSVIRLYVGGQWGYVQRGQQRLPAVRTHSGRLCFPHHQVLDHVINGQADSIGAWFLALARGDTSPTPRDEDYACDIAANAGKLTAAKGLPYSADIPGAQLDYSVASLRHLDRYLVRIAQNIATIPGPALGKLVLAAGAYLGEVIRINTADRACWQWVNYDDHVVTNPGFIYQRPRELGFMAFLDSKTQTCYPFEHVASVIAGSGAVPVLDFALQLLGSDAAAEPTPSSPPSPAESTPQTLPEVINQWRSQALMATELQHVRDTLAQWRLMACHADYNGMRPAGPPWLQHDSLGESLKQRDMLLAKGRVVWGALVQANGSLFEAGPDDHPAALACSLDPHFDSRPQALRVIGKELFAHKGNDAPQHVRRVAAFLADELERAYDIPVPAEMTDRKVMISAFMVFRKDLPEAMLRGAWFPVLTHPDTRAVIIVPRRFWSEILTAFWEEGVLDVE